MPNTKKPNIKFIRLVTGEDVVSEVQESENGLCLINPLKIIYGVNQKTGYISISLSQWIFTKITDNSTYNISSNNILIISDASENMIGYYGNTLFSFNSSMKETGSDYDDEYDEDEDLDEITDDDLDKIKDMIDSTLSKNKRLHWWLNKSITI